MVAHNVSAGSIKAQFPEFQDLENSYIELFINNAEIFSNTDVFNSQAQANMAVSYMTAHLMKSTGAVGGFSGGGPLVEEKVGDLMRKYANNAQRGNWLSTTGYGQGYLQLRKTIFKNPILIC